MSAADRLAALGIELWTLPPRAPWQSPTAVSEGVAYVSGQVPFVEDGVLLDQGVLEDESDVERGRACARQCAIHVLAQLGAAAGSLENVEQLLKLTVFVASGPRFVAQPLVANGASEFLYEVLGPAGRHARSAIGVASLPLGCPVEIEAVARIRQS